MPFGAALTFDSHTESALRALWQAQSQAGLPSSLLSTDAPPHMTLMMAEDAPTDHLRVALEPLAASLNPTRVEFLSLGIFHAKYGVIYLAPVVNTALLNLHSAFWKVAAPLSIHPGEHYRPGIWVPHVTLAYDLPPDQIGPVAAFLANQDWPDSATVTHILYGHFNLQGNSSLESIPLGVQT